MIFFAGVLRIPRKGSGIVLKFCGDCRKKCLAWWRRQRTDTDGFSSSWRSRSDAGHTNKDMAVVEIDNDNSGTPIVYCLVPAGVVTVMLPAKRDEQTRLT